MFKLVQAQDRKISIQTILHVVGRATSDADLRTRLRTVAAVLLARHCEDDVSDPVTIAMNEPFYNEGRLGTVHETIWFCSYVGYERVTSAWGVARGYTCVICLRMVEMNIAMREQSEHTLQIYF